MPPGPTSKTGPSGPPSGLLQQIRLVQLPEKKFFPLLFSHFFLVLCFLSVDLSVFFSHFFSLLSFLFVDLSVFFYLQLVTALLNSTKRLRDLVSDFYALCKQMKYPVPAQTKTVLENLVQVFSLFFLSFYFSKFLAQRGEGELMVLGPTSATDSVMELPQLSEFFGSSTYFSESLFLMPTGPERGLLLFCFPSRKRQSPGQRWTFSLGTK